MAEHCESCGATDYESLHTGDQGYTACCNERICYGGIGDMYAVGLYRQDGSGKRGEVTACCSAVADSKAKKLFKNPNFIALWRI